MFRTTCEVGAVEGGDGANIVLGFCRAEGQYHLERARGGGDETHVRIPSHLGRIMFVACVTACLVSLPHLGDVGAPRPALDHDHLSRVGGVGVSKYRLPMTMNVCVCGERRRDGEDMGWWC